MDEQDQRSWRDRRRDPVAAENRMTRVGRVLAQVLVALIILVGLQYLLRELARVAFAPGP